MFHLQNTNHHHCPQSNRPLSTSASLQGKSLQSTLSSDPSNAFDMQQRLKVFWMQSGSNFFHASLIHLHMVRRSGATSSGCKIEVIPPGMIATSVLCSFLRKSNNSRFLWQRKASSTSNELSFFIKPPWRFDHTAFTQSFINVWFIHPFGWALTITLKRELNSFGRSLPFEDYIGW